MSRQQIAVIDYGMGNLHSAASALRHVAPDAEVVVTADKQVIASADRVIFPGVGAIRDCVGEIRRLGFDQCVAEVMDSGKPMLAICIGMQALMQQSEENGGVKCLGHFAGAVRFFSDNAEFNLAHDESSQSGERLKVPHMGWNQVQQTVDHPLWHNIDNGTRFYFVHSYYVKPEDENIISGTAHYGINFCSALARNYVFAVQFHPEKSHNSGLQLLKNFISWNGK